MMRILGALLVAGSFVIPAQAKEDEAEWTFMLYWAGDNNLEFRTVANLQSMMQFGSNEKVNLVVFADRHPAGKEKRGFTNDPIGNIPNFDGAKIFYVKKGELEEIEDLEEVNDGDPKVLRHFVETAVSKYPAQKYALILRNHGGAFQGACWDDTDKHDQLSLTEIRSVLADTSERVGGKLDLVGFDMCLCANLETAHAVAPYAKYLSASEDLAYGSNYTFIMKRFMKDPEMDGAGLAKVYVEAYKEQHAKGGVATYSAIDLGKIPALAEAIGELAKVGAEAIEKLGEDAWYKLAEVQSNAEEYGTSGGKSGGYHLFDIIQLTAMLRKVGGDVAEKAEDVETAAREAILANFCGEERPNANGLSIYFPVESTNMAKVYSNIPFAKDNAWAEFVGTMTGTADKDKTPPEVQEVKVDDPELTEDETAKVRSSIKARDVDEAFFVIAVKVQEDELIMGNLPIEPGKNGELSVDWDGKWFTIQDAKTNLICPVTDWEEVNDAQDIFLVEIPVQVRLGGKGDWVDAVLYFRLDFNKDDVKGSLDSAWVDDGEKPYELELAAGDLIQPKYLRITKDGEEDWVVSGDDDQILKYAGAGSIHVGYERVPEGEYRIGFLARDYAGNEDESYTKMTIK